ncbi:hypothetical protein JCM3765_004701 [Sporobolomyces pararoseus]
MPTRHLPTELLEDIFSQLSSSKSALYNLSLSCRTFYFLCKPFLYSHITIVTRVQRERLLQVRKEDAKLVKKLVIKGKERHARSSRMDGTECTVGCNIIEDLFSGKLLDISVLETLHVAHLYENAYDQQTPETLKLIPASNLVEVSIYDHYGGGPFWKHFFADEENSPKLVRVGEDNISSYRPKVDLDPEENSFIEFKGVIESRTLIPLALRNRLQAHTCRSIPSTKMDVKKLSPFPLGIPEDLGFMAVRLRWLGNILLVSNSTIAIPSMESCQNFLDRIKSENLNTPIFLSLPFSRSDFTPDTLSIFSSIAELGIELHFALDEEEEDSISLIPQSFVKFVEKQKKLKEEKEREESKEKNERVQRVV